jgi:hypothetical protein
VVLRLPTVCEAILAALAAVDADGLDRASAWHEQFDSDVADRRGDADWNGR